jgi:hypothetical protein
LTHGRLNARGGKRRSAQSRASRVENGVPDRGSHRRGRRFSDAQWPLVTAID